jgi:hypothetical protein
MWRRSSATNSVLGGSCCARPSLRVRGSWDMMWSRTESVQHHSTACWHAATEAWRSISSPFSDASPADCSSAAAVGGKEQEWGARRALACRVVLPGRDSPGEQQGLDAALLVILDRFLSYRRPALADVVRCVRAEQCAQRHRPPGKELVEHRGLRRSEINGGGLSILVIQEAVIRAEVEQLAPPRSDRDGQLGGAACRACVVGGRRRGRRGVGHGWTPVAVGTAGGRTERATGSREDNQTSGEAVKAVRGGGIRAKGNERRGFWIRRGAFRSSTPGRPILTYAS